MEERSEHGAVVEAWHEGAVGALPAAGVVDLFDTALRAIWGTAIVTLGEVTMRAIVERVLSNAGEAHGAFAGLSVGPEGVSCRTLREGPQPERAALVAGSRLVLVELLTVLGNLTAEILTPDLHAALRAVGRPPASALSKEPRPVSTVTQEIAGRENAKS